MQQSEAGWPAAPSSVREARRFVAQTLERWGADELEWAATTIVSELASNAVLHAATPFTLRLQRRGDGLRIELADGSPVPPAMRRFGAESATGRGIRLVEQLSGTWGWVELDDGKVVWCEVVPGGGGGWSLDQEAGSDMDLDALVAALEPADLSAGARAVTRGGSSDEHGRSERASAPGARGVA